jgi:carbohydrate-binding DOMON domain-containing protein
MKYIHTYNFKIYVLQFSIDTYFPQLIRRFNIASL